jgi:rare lipoprotein A
MAWLRRSRPLWVAPTLLAASLGSFACGGGAGGTAGFNPPIPDSHATADPGSDFDFARRSKAPSIAPDQVGLATWYGASLAGHKTANGERFDPSGMTAAHRTLKMGTWVEVRRPDTGSSVRVRINDRGPFGDKRKVIDLARAAADKLGIVREGAARVELRVVRGPE